MNSDGFSPTPAADDQGAGRCGWCGTAPDYVAYHDEEWGRPELSSRALWEKLVLDGFQAGLAWITILRKRENFRNAFEGFDPERIARWGEADVDRLMSDAGIVRSRSKIAATIGNARAWCAIEEREGFDQFLWRFVDFRPVQNAPETLAEVHAETPLSREVSKALKAEGFRFCGPVITYAFLQATGLVNDHLAGCPARAACAAEAAALPDGPWTRHP
ncbi:MAG: DNA-3-methyladenine glycosylase I [Pseudomonadota bacterium]